MIKVIEALEEFIETAITIAKDELNKNNEITPMMAFGNRIDGIEKFDIKVIPIPNFMMEPGMKNELSDVMHRAADTLKPEFFVFLSDTWVKSFSNNNNTADDDMNKSREEFKEVRLMPDKKEAVLIVGETNKKQYTRMMIYEKQNDGSYKFTDEKTTIIDFESKIEQGKMTGRFANVLFGKPIPTEKN